MCGGESHLGPVVRDAIVAAHTAQHVAAVELVPTILLHETSTVKQSYETLIYMLQAVEAAHAMHT